VFSDNNGYAVIVGPGGQQKEFDTATCAHCNKVYCISTNSKEMSPEPIIWCSLCQDRICVTCAKKPCLPFEKRLEEYERKSQFGREYGLM
jgi:hypothetical protein